MGMERVGVERESRREQRESLEQLRIRERLIRLGIAAFVPLFAVAGVFASLSERGPATPVRVAVVWIVFATTIPVAAIVGRMGLGSLWWSRRDRYRVGGALFVLYADVGVSVVLFSFVDHGLALTGTALFAVVSAYSAHFVTAAVHLAHGVGVSTVIVVLGVLAAHTTDTPAVVAQVCVLLLVVNGPAAVVGVYSTDVRREFARHVRAASRDPLTGLLNRRAFDSRTLELLRSTGTRVGVAVLDVDHFKSVNDAGGHTEGDRLLVQIARQIADFAPENAAVARIGGDEFAVAGLVGGETLSTWTENLRRAATASTSVTVSAGAAELHPADASGMALTRAVHRADTALYAAKRVGGDQSVAVEEHDNRSA